MEKDALTPEEKAKLLGHKDARTLEDYDEEFYKLLRKPDVPGLENLDDRIRHAIFKFVDGYYENVMERRLSVGPPEDSMIKSGLTIFLLRGYELGRKLRRPLTAKRVPQ